MLLCSEALLLRMLYGQEGGPTQKLVRYLRRCIEEADIAVGQRCANQKLMSVSRWTPFDVEYARNINAAELSAASRYPILARLLKLEQVATSHALLRFLNQLIRSNSYQVGVVCRLAALRAVGVEVKELAVHYAGWLGTLARDALSFG